MRNLEFQADVDPSVAELSDGPIEIVDAVDEDWLVAVQMLGEQERRRSEATFRLGR